ncbi:hypothetical protein CCB80_04260 [Armatimonadetes bacterium Uphvl-Ar1]|nr:hypothetical protein CCB80_04260 [Armatimonadetes bacterium Uphvl-Ar1]
MLVHLIDLSSASNDTAMNPFAIRQSPKGWVLPLSILALVVGMLGSLAFSTEQAKQRTAMALEPGMRNEVANEDLDLAKEVAKLRDEVGKLREDKTKLETTLAEAGNASKAINDSLQDTKSFAGLTSLKGPGLIITLSDSKKPPEEMLIMDNGIIHYLDVLKTVNELFNSGAEAISVNGLRVGPRTDFRCVGSVILVDTQRIAPPVVIKAIGDTKTLLGAMNLPGGVLTDLRDLDPEMVKIEPASEIVVPAYEGSAGFKFAEVIEVPQ